MNKFWAFLLGTDRLTTGHVENWHIYWRLQSKPGWYVLLFLTAAAGSFYLVWWFYKREPEYCKRRRRIVMAVLRMLGLAVLWTILAGPTLALEMTGTIKSKVLVLLDASGSMTRQDHYARPADLARAARVIGVMPPDSKDATNLSEAGKKKIEETNREALVRAMFTNKALGLWGKLWKDYDVEVRTFARGEDLHAPGGAAGREELRRNPEKLFAAYKAGGDVTEIGNALKRAVRDMKGQPLAGIVLVGDGGNNRGLDPLVVAKNLGVPVLPVGIGVPRPRDTAISALVVERKLFVDDAAPLTVRLKQYACAGEEVAVTATSGKKELARKRVTLKAEETTVTLRVRFDKPGTYTLRVESPPLPGDAEPANNIVEQEVEVVDKKLRVLVVEAEPRWEYRFLKNALLRDKRVEAKILFFGQDRKKLAEIPGGAYIAEFPRDKKELFQYDVVVLGNVPRERCFTDEDLERLRAFVVEEGGGLWMIAGKNNFPDTYVGSKLEELIPVEFERNPAVSVEDERLRPLTEPFRVKLTPAGRTHSLTRLDPEAGPQNEAGNARLWAMMPEMYWRHKTKRAKLNAVTLLVYDGPDNAERLRRNEPPEPVLVTARVGKGRVLYSSVRDFFRMRFPAEMGPKALERFQAHAVQYLGLPHLLGENRRVELHTDKPEYVVGDQVHVYARVLDRQSYEPLVTARLEAVSTAKDGRGAERFQLTPAPGEPGHYRGKTKAKSEGDFRITLPEEDEVGAYTDYQVRTPRVEMEEPGMRKELLDKIATLSNPGNRKARTFFPDEPDQLVKALRTSEEELKTRFEDPLWDSPLFLLAFVLLFGLEWLIRKRSDLC